MITVVETAMARYGLPEHLRSDNGPEFIAYAIQARLKAKRAKTIYIRPGAPWENAYIENVSTSRLVHPDRSGRHPCRIVLWMALFRPAALKIKHCRRNPDENLHRDNNPVFDQNNRSAGLGLALNSA
jgi:transposase InsO family protein